MRDAVTAISEFLLGKEESAALRNRLVAGMGGLLGLRIGFGALSFLSAILLARMLGPGGFGAYSYAFAWILLLVIPAVLGADQLLLRDVAAHSARGEWGLVRGLLRKANGAVLLASLAIGVVAASVTWILRHHWSWQMLSTFWVALLLLPLIALTQVRRGTLQGLHRVVLGSIPESLIKPALLLLLLGLAYLGLHGSLTAQLAMGLNVMATAIAFGVGTFWLYRLLPQPARTATPVYRDRDWMRSSLPLMFIAGMGVACGQADTLILGAIKGARSVGFYSAATKSAELISFVLAAQITAFSSTAASLYAVNDLERLQRLVTKLTRWTLLLSLPLAIGFIGLGHWFLLYCYGPEFTHARIALAILSLGQVVNVGMGPVGTLLTMTGHERDTATAIAAGAAANVALTLLLVPRWGPTGAALGNALSITLWNIWMAVLLHRRTGIHATALGLLRGGS